MNKSLDVYFSHDQLLIISALKKTYEEEIDRLEERLKKYNMEKCSYCGEWTTCADECSSCHSMVCDKCYMYSSCDYYNPDCCISNCPHCAAICKVCNGNFCIKCTTKCDICNTIVCGICTHNCEE